MTHKRHPRPTGEIDRAVDRLQHEPLYPLTKLIGRTVTARGVNVRLSEGVLLRWVAEGRVGDEGRAWLDAVKRGSAWLTSEAALLRFLAQIEERVRV
jgi:hypothetical protein